MKRRQNPYLRRIPYHVAVPGLTEPLAMPDRYSFPVGDQTWPFQLVAWNHDEPVSWARFCTSMRAARSLARRWLREDLCEDVEIVCRRARESVVREVWSQS